MNGCENLNRACFKKKVTVGRNFRASIERQKSKVKRKKFRKTL